MKIKSDLSLKAEEVVALRKLSGWDHDLAEWKLCLSQNLLNVSARNDKGELVGVGFLSGNARHAELVDLVVHPEHREAGIGREIVRYIVSYAREHRIKYFGLTYDTEFPWLKEFYESEGFRSVDFAMWHVDSL